MCTLWSYVSYISYLSSNVIHVLVLLALANTRNAVQFIALGKGER